MERWLDFFRKRFFVLSSTVYSEQVVTSHLSITPLNINSLHYCLLSQYFLNIVLLIPATSAFNHGLRGGTEKSHRKRHRKWSVGELISLSCRCLYSFVHQRVYILSLLIEVWALSIHSWIDFSFQLACNWRVRWVRRKVCGCRCLQQIQRSALGWQSRLG